MPCLGVFLGKALKYLEYGNCIVTADYQPKLQPSARWGAHFLTGYDLSDPCP